MTDIYKLGKEIVRLKEVIKAKEAAIKELKAMVTERDNTIRKIKEEYESLYESLCNR